MANEKSAAEEILLDVKVNGVPRWEPARRETMAKFPVAVLLLKLPADDKSDWKWMVMLRESVGPSARVWHFILAFPRWITRRRLPRRFF